MRLRSLLTGYARENVIQITVNVNYPERKEIVISYRQAIENPTHIGLSSIDDTIPEQILKFFPANIEDLNYTVTIPYKMLSGNIIEKTRARVEKLGDRIFRKRN